MRWNPLSLKRRDWILRYLETKLRRNKQLDRLSTIQPKLAHLDEADPSPSGEYSRWLVDLLLKNDIDLPEDAGKLNELLTVFHRVKTRLPKELRDIQKFTSYSQLRITLLPMLPQLKSLAELQREGSELLVTVHIGQNVYQIYKLTTAEATAKAAQGSGWCVCNEKTAAHYLADGPLYLIVKNDKRFILAHAESVQVMDFHDTPIHYSEDYSYDEVLSLFKQYLPQFICEKHDKLENLACQDCPEKSQVVECLDGGMQLCSNEECQKEICKKHSYKCSSCEEIICHECNNNCHEDFCPNCVRKCARCEGQICSECSYFADCCQNDVCGDCATHCSGCDTTYCNNCAQFILCERCGAAFCEDCRTEGKQCSGCDRYLCSDCKKKFKQCDECGEPSCCGANCNVCAKRLCADCNQQLRMCQGCDLVYCEECLPARCDLCRKHIHGAGECAFCWDEEANEPELLCEGCSEQCRICDRFMCGKYQQQCGCNSAMLHYFCPDCYSLHFCTKCNVPICDPEDHIMCAYLGRRRKA